MGTQGNIVSASGAFTLIKSGTLRVQTATGAGDLVMTLDASKSNSIYYGSALQPAACQCLVAIRF